jgi:hypothetical protein
VNDAGQLLSGLAALGRLVPDGARLVGVGWATVDLDRTLAGLPDPEAAGPLTDEPSLGARARVVQAGSVALVVLEPSTEGRLAAALARRGEGIACLYVTGPAPLAGGRSTALGVPGRLLPHDRPWGPFTMLVAEPDPPDRASPIEDQGSSSP